MGVLGLFGAGIASAAPDVEGMTYEDAVAAIEEDGGIPKIAVTVGDRQDAMGACLVTRVTDGSLSGPSRMTCTTGTDEGEVLLTLNCNRGAATADYAGRLGGQRRRAATSQAKAEEAAAAAQSEEANSPRPAKLPGVPGQLAE